MLRLVEIVIGVRLIVLLKVYFNRLKILHLLTLNGGSPNYHAGSVIFLVLFISGCLLLLGRSRLLLCYHLCVHINAYLCEIYGCFSDFKHLLLSVLLFLLLLLCFLLLSSFHQEANNQRGYSTDKYEASNNTTDNRAYIFSLITVVAILVSSNEQIDAACYDKNSINYCCIPLFLSNFLLLQC